MSGQQNEPKVQRRFADHSRTAWGYTYFVRRDDLIKIGHSGAPKQRFRNLGQPREVLAVVSNVIVDEPTAHRKFAHLRVKGEWFQGAPELLEFIEWAKSAKSWNGGKCPENPDSQIRPYYRGPERPEGTRIICAPAQRLDWSHDGGPDDITLYIVEFYATPR